VLLELCSFAHLMGGAPDIPELAALYYSESA
jgi:hypothetical protein